MPSLSRVRDKVNDWLTDRWPAVQARQDAYFAAHGRYWQGLRTHTFEFEYTDSDNPDHLADGLANKPTDQPESWLDEFPALAIIQFPAVLTMDVYDGPSGNGYVATVVVKYLGTFYRRSQNVGPETWRTQDWHVFDPTGDLPGD